MNSNPMPRESEKSETTGVAVIGTQIAFYIWLTLLLASLATFALGILGHIVALLAAPWLSLLTEATIHATIPIFLTAVKFVTVPLLLLLLRSPGTIRRSNPGQIGAKSSSAVWGKS